MGSRTNTAKRDSIWVGTPVIESTFFVHAGKNRTIYTEETFIGYKKYDVAKNNKKGDIDIY